MELSLLSIERMEMIFFIGGMTFVLVYFTLRRGGHLSLFSLCLWFGWGLLHQDQQGWGYVSCLSYSHAPIQCVSLRVRDGGKKSRSFGDYELALFLLYFSIY